MKGGRRGIAIVWVSIAIVVMLSLVGLALDTGYAVLVGNQLQNGADAAALAGAQTVATDQATARARASTAGAANSAAGSSLTFDQNTDVEVGYFHPSTKVFTASGVLPNAVRAHARRTGTAHGAVPLLFGAAYGSPTMDMTRDAVASINVSVSPALLVMDPTGEYALDLTGSARIRVPNGGVLVNSSHPNGTRLGGSSILDTPALAITTSSIPDISHLTGQLATNRAPQSDPMAWLPEPTPGPAVETNKVVVGTGNTRTLEPGYYPGGINVRGTLVMNPGIYILDDDFEANSQASVTGNGVMIFLRGSANMGFNSDGMTLLLNPPTSGLYQGVTIFQQRGNTAASSLPVSGTAIPNGTIYIPSAQLNITSSGGSGGVKLLVWRLNVSGSGTLTITGQNQISTTGNPFLVE
ncbi:MAG TPA: pilus assembly protein TadG-related protein [Phycisphaerales bacterium]|nr:pilus assembly protein TadG-related protein [Phycisphaerales bacterium]